MDYVKPKDDVSKVKDLELFDELIHASLDLSKRYEALREAAQYRMVPSTSSYAKPGAMQMRQEDLSALRKIRHAQEGIDMAIQAMQFGGRDPRKPRAEILSCLSKKGRHQLDTITKRYFGTQNPMYRADGWIEDHLNELIKKGYVATDNHKRNYSTVYLLVTPERRAEWKKEREARKVREAAREAEKARLATVLTALKALGVEGARGAKYDDTRVAMDVADVEKLIAMASAKKECA
jgi:hypothetical protein